MGKPKKKKLKSTPKSRRSDVRRKPAASFSSDEDKDVEVGPSGGGVHRGGSDSEEEGSGDDSGEWSDSGGSESSEPSLEFNDGLDENLIGDTDDRARCVVYACTYMCEGTLFGWRCVGVVCG